jgi:hypothetical protein
MPTAQLLTGRDCFAFTKMAALQDFFYEIAEHLLARVGL